MQCEDCGDAISLSTARRRDGQFVCPDCYTNGQQQTQPSQQQRSVRQEQPAHDQKRQSSTSAAPQESADSSGSGPSGDSRSPKRQPPATSQTNGASPQNEPRVAVQPPAEKRFNALRRYGKIVSGCGWLLTALGILCAILTFSAGEAGGMMEGIARLFGFFGGVFAAVFGLLMVVLGQQATCFVAIERNTRSTYELIHQSQQA